MNMLQQKWNVGPNDMSKLRFIRVKGNDICQISHFIKVNISILHTYTIVNISPK